MLRLRSAAATDQQFLREVLYLALFVPPGKPPFPREILNDPKIAHYVDSFGCRPGDVGFIAEDDRPIGAAWVRLLTSADPGYAYVDDATPEVSIAVVATHRGSGVGTALLDRLFEEVPRCALSVDDRNPAIGLYRRFGFVAIASGGHSVTMLRTPLPPA